MNTQHIFASDVHPGMKVLAKSVPVESCPGATMHWMNVFDQCGRNVDRIAFIELRAGGPCREISVTNLGWPSDNGSWIVAQYCMNDGYTLSDQNLIDYCAYRARLTDFPDRLEWNEVWTRLADRWLAAFDFAD